ncbi:MAG: cyclodeaminase/cyclohydrolase family protein [Candidatus Tumulicola sp.]
MKRRVFGERRVTSAAAIAPEARGRSRLTSPSVETLDLYLQNLASAEAIPGGGSAAALVASAGAALVGMVARICERNPKYAEYASTSREAVAASDELRRRLLAARERDERAFGAVVAAQDLPKETAEQRALRGVALETALQRAAEEPLETAALALDVVRLSERVAQIPNKNLASDVGCAAEFGAAALAACGYNVRVNHRYMRDERAIAHQAETFERYEGAAAEALSRVRAAVGTALRRSL